MARWNSAQGPTVAFAFTGAAAAIPQTDITRAYDGGPCLVCINVEMNAGAGGAANTQVFPTLDGAAVAGGLREDLAVNGIVRRNYCLVVNVTPGLHTWAAAVNGPAAAGNQIPASGCRIAVVELPAWDDEANLAF